MLRSLFTSSAALILLSAAVAQADDPPKVPTLKVGPAQVEIGSGSATQSEESANAKVVEIDPRGLATKAGRPAVKLGEYWIGIECNWVTDALAKRFDLPEAQGVFVFNVVLESPAHKAGLERGDVLLKVGGKPLTKAQDLIDAIEEAGSERELTLQFARAGETREITVTPENRPEKNVRLAFVPTPGDPDWERLHRWFGRMGPGVGGGRGSMRFRFIQPGTILPPGATVHPPLPENMTIIITKTGDKPAGVVVKRDGEQWEVTEDQLDKLPETVRPHVEQMLGHMPGRWFGKAPEPGDLQRFDFIPEWKWDGPALPALPEAFQKRFDEMHRQMEELHKAIDKMRESPREQQPAKGANEA